MHDAYEKPAPRGRLRTVKNPLPVKRSPSKEAIMTLLAIMQDDEDPKLQIAAAKALLGKEAKNTETALQQESATDSEPMSPDEFAAILTAAKAILDELAARKTISLVGAGAMADGSTAGTDYPER